MPLPGMPQSTEQLGVLIKVFKRVGDATDKPFVSSLAKGVPEACLLVSKLVASYIRDDLLGDIPATGGFKWIYFCM